MNERNDTRREVVLDVLNEPIASLDELIQQCHRALSAHLWTTCCWSKNGSGWKIGDFNYLVVSVRPDADTSLYVQFWSEPRERVLTEIGSGNCCPGAIRYIGPEQRKALEERGYTIGGRARNYTKELVIDSAMDAEAAALDILKVFFEVFGYRGQWRLEIERHRGERAGHEAVHTSVTPEDFAKIAVRIGCEATVRTDGDQPVVVLKRGRITCFAVMHWHVTGRNLFSLISLQGELRLNQPITDDAIAHVNSNIHLFKLCRSDNDAVRVQMALALNGGVTVTWIARSLRHWSSSWHECERQLQRFVPARQWSASEGSALVH